MEIDLEVPESIDFSEFPVTESVENKDNKKQGKHKEETSLISVQKVDKATQTISKRVLEKNQEERVEKKARDLAYHQS